MEEKKYKFDQFNFLSNREYGIEPTEEDFNNFGNFMTCAALSMYKEHIRLARHFNSFQFSKLTKKQQCLAYTSLDGYSLSGTRYLKTGVKQYKTEIEKLSKLFKVSPREAKNMLSDKFIDIEKALSLYSEIYEPESLITKTGKIKSSKS